MNQNFFLLNNNYLELIGSQSINICSFVTSEFKIDTNTQQI